MKIVESLIAHAEENVRLRRDIHAHPELCFEENRTADIVTERLTSWGIEVHRGIGGTGVVGVIRKGHSLRGVALRADMDALPIQEENQFSHASRHLGKMHACGHDGHTAMLLSAARVLAQETEFDGRVVLVFQPAEEGGGGGAAKMIEDGLFERFPVDAIFGLHNWPGMPVGTFAVCDGPCFASGSRFKITLKGKGAHAAMPHLGLDPVPAACQIVQSFQTILTRNKRPADTGIISVTMFHAGEALNAIPNECVVQGTVRTFTAEVLDLIERRMSTIAERTAEAFELNCQFDFRRTYPPTINHPKETAFIRELMLEVAGPGKVTEFEPTMAAEDFSFFLQKKPGTYFVLGNGDGNHRESLHGPGPCALHNASYDFNDELIPVGATFWIRLVERWLKA